MRVDGIADHIPAAELAASWRQGNGNFEQILTKIQDAPAAITGAVPLTKLAPVAPVVLQATAAAVSQPVQDAAAQAATAPRPSGPLGFIQRIFSWIGNTVMGVVNGVRSGIAKLFNGNRQAAAGATAAAPAAGATPTAARAATIESMPVDSGPRNSWR